MPALVAGIHVAMMQASFEARPMPFLDTRCASRRDGRDIGERSDAVFDGFARP
jgi:hypothetical protein